MAKRILHVIPSLDRAGAEKQMTLLVRGLPRSEFDVHVCALTRGGPLEADLREAEIPLTLIGKRWRADPLAYRRLKRLIGGLGPDLVPPEATVESSITALAERFAREALDGLA